MLKKDISSRSNLSNLNNANSFIKPNSEYDTKPKKKNHDRYKGFIEKQKKNCSPNFLLPNHNQAHLISDTKRDRSCSSFVIEKDNIENKNTERKNSKIGQMKRTIMAIHSQINNIGKKSPRNNSSKNYRPNNKSNVTREKVHEFKTVKKSFLNETHQDKQLFQDNKQLQEKQISSNSKNPTNGNNMQNQRYYNRKNPINKKINDLLNINQTQGQCRPNNHHKTTEVPSEMNSKRHNLNTNLSNTSNIFSSPNCNRHLKTEATLNSLSRNKEFSEYNYIQDIKPKHESFLRNFNKSILNDRDKGDRSISKSVYNINKSILKRRDSAEILKSKSQKRYNGHNKTITEADNSNSSLNQKVGKFDIGKLNHMEKKILNKNKCSINVNNIKENIKQSKYISLGNNTSSHINTTCNVFNSSKRKLNSYSMKDQDVNKLQSNKSLKDTQRAYSFLETLIKCSNKSTHKEMFKGNLKDTVKKDQSEIHIKNISRTNSMIAIQSPKTVLKEKKSNNLEKSFNNNGTTIKNTSTKLQKTKTDFGKTPSSIFSNYCIKKFDSKNKYIDNSINDDSFLLCNDEELLQKSIGKENLVDQNDYRLRIDDEDSFFLCEKKIKEAETKSYKSFKKSCCNTFNDLLSKDNNREGPRSININLDESDILKNFLEDEEIHKIDLSQIMNLQDEVKMRMRAILYDWISEICSDYNFSRETYYTAIKYIDNFLMRYKDVPKSMFQLVGICSVFIAMKYVECEVVPSDELLILASGIFNKKELCDMEKQILNTIDWNLNTITLNHWQAFQTYIWDNFANSYLAVDMKIPQSSVYIYRKFSDVNSYSMYRELCQYLDACILVPEHLNYNGGLLVIAFIYLQISVNLKVFEKSDIINYFSNSSWYVQDETLSYNSIFNKFLEKTLNVTLEELLPFIQFASQFFSLPIEYLSPNSKSLEDFKANKGVGLETLFSYMIHNEKSLQFVCERNF